MGIKLKKPTELEIERARRERYPDTTPHDGWPNRGGGYKVRTYSPLSDTLVHADRAARMGFVVVPLDKITGSALLPPSQGSRHRPTLKEWYRGGGYPDAGVGIVCGEMSGVVALLERHPDPGELRYIGNVRITSGIPFIEAGGMRYHLFEHPGVTCQTTRDVVHGVDLLGEGAVIPWPPSKIGKDGRAKWGRPLHLGGLYPLPLEVCHALKIGGEV